MHTTIVTKHVCEHRIMWFRDVDTFWLPQWTVQALHHIGTVLGPTSGAKEGGRSTKHTPESGGAVPSVKHGSLFCVLAGPFIV